MLIARNLGEFRTQPDGSYVAGRHWLYFSFDRTLFGYSLWGTPSPEDLGSLIHLLELELDREPHAAVVDVSGVETMRRDSFEVLASYVTRHAPRLAQVVTHTAMVRSRGLNGAIAGGFFSAVASPFPVSFWDDLGAAFAHVGHRRSSEAADALRASVAAADGVPVVLRALRYYLEAHLSRISLAAAARGLRTTSRTLQRRLREHGTSFTDEAQEARVRVAERLLLETDEPVTTIALEVGCTSSQHFSALFRHRRGEAPSAFRTHRRRA